MKKKVNAGVTWALLMSLGFMIVWNLQILSDYLDEQKNAGYDTINCECKCGGTNGTEGSGK
jgi:hypothetical protein